MVTLWLLNASDVYVEIHYHTGYDLGNVLLEFL